MRDYKFRGKTKNGEWIYGSLLLINDKAYIREGQYGDLDDIDFGWGFEEVMPETVGQFTGLLDKNGVEIYEGDILGRCFDDYDENCIVKYKNGMLILETVNSRAIRPCNIDRGFGWSELKYYTHYRNGFEVIGNIHDNSDLLK